MIDELNSGSWVFVSKGLTWSLFLIADFWPFAEEACSSSQPAAECSGARAPICDIETEIASSVDRRPVFDVLQ